MNKKYLLCFQILAIFSITLYANKCLSQPYYGKIKKGEKEIDTYFLIRNCHCKDSVVHKAPLLFFTDFSFSVIDSTEILMSYLLEDSHMDYTLQIIINKIKINGSIESKTTSRFSSRTYSFIKNRTIYTKDGFLYMAKNNIKGDPVKRTYVLRMADEESIKKIFEEFDKL